MLKQIGRITPLLMLALAPAGLAAQQTGQQLPPEAQELVMEIQQIQMQLQPVQQEALQDADIQARQQALGERIQQAMIAADPTVEASFERLNELQAEAQAAQLAEDQQKLGQLVTEAQGIEGQLRAAQMAALENPEVVAEVEQFEARVQAKMVELNPEVAPLIERYKELDSQLQQMLRG